MGSKSDSSKNSGFPDEKKSHWSRGLLKSMKNPEVILLEDELVTVIKDLYPKAKFHYLVCCKANISSIRDVRSKHLPLLKHMQSVAEKLCSKHTDSNFLVGYHSVPSMARLHLHVISDDFDSPCLKTKKHWNSFTTEFFIPGFKVIKELETKGGVTFKTVSESKVFLNQPLKCHKCDYTPKYIPDLKHHLKIHLK